MAILLPTREELVLLPEWYEINPNIEEDLETLLTSRRPYRAKTPLGYVVTGDPSEVGFYCEPVEQLLCGLIQLMKEFRYEKKRSLRDCLSRAQLMCSECDEIDYTISSQGGLSIILTRLEKELGLVEKDTSRERIPKLRQERMERLRAEGKARPYHFSTENKKKIEKQKELTKVNKELKRLKQEEKRLKVKAARKARDLKLRKDPTKYTTVDDEGKILAYEQGKAENRTQNADVPAVQTKNLVDIYLEGLSKGENESLLMEMYKEIMEKKDTMDKRRIVFLPTPRQYLFMSAPEDVVLYGGAAGGGKSYAMVIDPLRYAHHKDHNAVIIRKTMPDLNELIDTSRELYPLAFPGCKYRETDHVWTFPSGAKIRFGFLDKPADKFRYQGKAYTYIGFDELSQHATPEGFNYVRTRLRRTNRDIYPYVRATANPGSQWVYDMFIAPEEPGKPFIMKGTENSTRPITMRFIPAKLEDNPHLDIDGMYRSVLESMDEVLRRQLLDGDWLASNDNMFPEFDINLHVCEPFAVPRHWNRIAGLDYGYRDPSAATWIAVNPEDGSLIVYDEFLQTGLTGREFALAIQEREQNELVYVDHPVDWSIYARTGHTGPTIAESMLTVPGFKMRRADKNREAGWIQVHEYLRKDPNTGAPKIQIFSTCRNTIRQLMSVKVNKNKPGDIDDTRTADGHWDLLDALRYAIMSRPRLESWNNNLTGLKQTNRWEQINNYFRV